jgi:hypothetical protein
MADYVIPLHNLSIYNPDEFPLQVTTSNESSSLHQILQITQDNATIISSNTELIDSFNTLNVANIANSTTLQSQTIYTLALPGAIVPLNVSFMLIVNLNLLAGTNGVTTTNCIQQVVAYLYNASTGLVSQQVWQQQPIASPTNTEQTTLAVPFTFVGIGNGYAYSVKYYAKLLNNGTYSINNAQLIGVNDIQMLWV